MDKVYYIKGSFANPEDVEQALLEVCPNAENPSCLSFKNKCGIYYILDGVMYYSELSSITAKVIKMFGTELQPKKQEKFVEKTMFKCIKKGVIYSRYCETEYFYSTIEEAMSQPNAIGYQEVKVIVKE